VKLTLPIVTVPPGPPGGVIVGAPETIVQLGALPQFPLKFVGAVPGSGLISGGGGNSIGCGSWISPPSTDALPLMVCAVTLFDVQLPTPARGVERLPQTVVGLPASVRLPLVPTLPNACVITGTPLGP